MNAANESSPAPSLRRLPFSVRLAPPSVNFLSAVLPEDDLSGEVEGLLFGIIETGFSVLRMFHLASPIPGLGRQANFEELLIRSRTNPQLAGFALLGWFSVRKVGGLQPDDIAFHETNFLRPNDIALILKREPGSEFSLELYCRTVDGTFTIENHRSGTIRVSSASPVTSPLEVPMRAHPDVHIPNLPVPRETETDDSFTFLREAFASSTKKAIDLLKTAKPEEATVELPVFNRTVVPSPPRNAGHSTPTPPSRAFGTSGGAAAAPAQVPKIRTQSAGPANQDGAQFRPNQPESPAASDLRKGPAATPDAVLIRSDDGQSRPAPDNASANANAASPQGAEAEASPREAPAPNFGMKPAYSPPLSRFATQVFRTLPWRILAAIFVVVAGATFGMIYLRGAHANGTLPQFVQAIWPTPGLDLKVTANGDRFQLSWNRNIPAVRNAREAILEINDGSNQHAIALGSSELENGSVLYLPTSDDVVFRLQVHGAAGQNATESLRVVGTAKSNVLEVSRPSDTPDDEPVPPASTLAANRFGTENAKTAATSRRKSVAPKPEGARLRETRPATDALPTSAAAGDRIAKLEVPTVPPSSSGPAPITREALQGPATAPPADTPAANLTGTNTPQSGEVTAPPKSYAPTASSVEKSNTSETAQLTKPDAQVVPKETITGKAAAVQTPAATPLPPAKADTTSAQSSVTYMPPRPIKQVLPKLATLPPGVADSVGEVKVAVRVDESGHVTGAQVIEGKSRVGPMLAKMALAAARQWTFEPASLRGKNIASEHTIVFQFRH